MNSIIPCYRLIGFVSIYNTTPDFIYPVFSAFDKYFFQDGRKYFIQNFSQIEFESLTKYRYMKICSTNSLYYNQYSLSVYAFEGNDSKVFMGNIRSFYNYIKYTVAEQYSYRNDLIEDYLKENEINYFLASQSIITDKSYQFKLKDNNLFDDCFFPSQSIGPIDEHFKRTYKHYINNNLKENYFFPLQSIGSIDWHLRTLQSIGPIDLHLRLTDKHCINYNSNRINTKLLKSNYKLYKCFCILVDEYTDICLIDYNEKNKVEFVSKMLYKKKWLLSVEQYDLINKLYGKNYLDPNIDYKNLIIENNMLNLENSALKLLISFLKDVLEDKKIYKLLRNMISNQ